MFTLTGNTRGVTRRPCFIMALALLAVALSTGGAPVNAQEQPTVDTVTENCPLQRVQHRDMTSSQIQRAKEILSSLGYTVGRDNSGEINGFFGQIVETAVGNFQEDNDLDRTEVIDALTWEALIRIGGCTASGHVSATEESGGDVEPASSPETDTVDTGDSGEAYAACKNRGFKPENDVKEPYLKFGVFGPRTLFAQEFLGLPSNGCYDENTVNAVEEFQRRYFLWIDGEIGPQTWRKINDVARERRYTPTGPTLEDVSQTDATNPACPWYQRHADGDRPRLVKGSEGPRVELIQVIIGAIQDGCFGSQTQRLLKSWQAGKGLIVDGEFDDCDWRAYFGETLTDDCLRKDQLVLKLDRDTHRGTLVRGDEVILRFPFIDNRNTLPPGDYLYCGRRGPVKLQSTYGGLEFVMEQAFRVCTANGGFTGYYVGTNPYNRENNVVYYDRNFNDGWTALGAIGGNIYVERGLGILERIRDFRFDSGLEVLIIIT